VSALIDDVVARMGWASVPGLSIVPLRGGITNLNYRVDAGGETYVVRIPGQDSAFLGIDRGREHACTVAAHQSGVAPAVVAFLKDSGIIITRFVRGRSITEQELGRPEMLPRVAEALGRTHGSPPFPGTFSPFEAVRHYLAATPQGVPLPERFEWMLAQADRLEGALGAPGALRPCHNDLLAGNFLDDGERLWILDWEYAGMGDPFFDLGNFAANQHLSDTAERTLLQAYFGCVPAGAAARVKLMKIISDLREAMWALVQGAISALDYDFRAYARAHFDRYTAALGDPRLPAWLTEAAAPASHD
jgi:thiamine kinase-like enzyme